MSRFIVNYRSHTTTTLSLPLTSYLPSAIKTKLLDIAKQGKNLFLSIQNSVENLNKLKAKVLQKLTFVLLSILHCLTIVSKKALTECFLNRDCVIS